MKRVAKELGERMTDEELQEMIDEARPAAAVEGSFQASFPKPENFPGIQRFRMCALQSLECANSKRDSHSITFLSRFNSGVILNIVIPSFIIR